MEISNMMQDEVIRPMNADDPDREDSKEVEGADKYDQTMVGVSYHAWLQHRAGGDTST